MGMNLHRAGGMRSPRYAQGSMRRGFRAIHESERYLISPDAKSMTTSLSLGAGSFHKESRRSDP